jgi:hypothetical protein
MKLNFKVIPNSKEDRWLGWFGDNVIKLRLTCPKENLESELINFIHENLGIRKEDMKLLHSQNPKLIAIEFPDVAWELFLSAIE